MHRIRSLTNRFLDWLPVRRVVTYTDGAAQAHYPMRVDPRLQAPQREGARGFMGASGP